MQALYLSNNAMKSLPSKLFKTCIQLSTLDLHNTEITIDLLRQVCTFFCVIFWTKTKYFISPEGLAYHSYVSSTEHVMSKKQTVAWQPNMHCFLAVWRMGQFWRAPAVKASKTNWFPGRSL